MEFSLQRSIEINRLNLKAKKRGESSNPPGGALWYESELIEVTRLEILNQNFNSADAHITNLATIFPESRTAKKEAQRLRAFLECEKHQLKSMAA